LLTQLDTNPNFKTKIHSAAALLKFKNPKAFEDPALYTFAWQSLVATLEQHNRSGAYASQE
jgi:hypothetical protein